jgi:hypothetical protein
MADARNIGEIRMLEEMEVEPEIKEGLGIYFQSFRAMPFSCCDLLSCAFVCIFDCAAIFSNGEVIRLLNDIFKRNLMYDVENEERMKQVLKELYYYVEKHEISIVEKMNEIGKIINSNGVIFQYIMRQCIYNAPEEDRLRNFQIITANQLVSHNDIEGLLAKIDVSLKIIRANDISVVFFNPGGFYEISLLELNENWYHPLISIEDSVLIIESKEMYASILASRKFKRSEEVNEIQLIKLKIEKDLKLSQEKSGLIIELIRQLYPNQNLHSIAAQISTVEDLKTVLKGQFCPHCLKTDNLKYPTCGHPICSELLNQFIYQMQGFPVCTTCSVVLSFPY